MAERTQSLLEAADSLLISVPLGLYRDLASLVERHADELNEAEANAIEEHQRAEALVEQVERLEAELQSVRKELADKDVAASKANLWLRDGYGQMVAIMDEPRAFIDGAAEMMHASTGLRDIDLWLALSSRFRIPYDVAKLLVERYTTAIDLRIVQLNDGDQNNL